MEERIEQFAERIRKLLRVPEQYAPIVFTLMFILLWPFVICAELARSVREHYVDGFITVSMAVIGSGLAGHVLQIMNEPPHPGPIGLFLGYFMTGAVNTWSEDTIFEYIAAFMGGAWVVVLLASL